MITVPWQAQIEYMAFGVVLSRHLRKANIPDQFYYLVFVFGVVVGRK
jgi:hypothetical protein